MNKICYIVGAAKAENIVVDKQLNDYIIAADGGYKTLINLNISPDFTLGDFDSLGCIPENCNREIYPSEKDQTDTFLAYELAYKKGYRNIVLYGGLGGRLDHTIANLQTASFFAEKGCKSWIWNENTCICVFASSILHFDNASKGYVSIFANSVATGVTIEGLKYNINNYTLTSSNPLGVSNEFINTNSFIKVVDGVLTVVWYDNSKNLLLKARND